MHRHKLCVFTYIFLTSMALSFHVLTLERVLHAVKGISLWSMPSRVVRIDTSDEFQTALDNANSGDHILNVDRSCLPGENEMKAAGGNS